MGEREKERDGMVSNGDGMGENKREEYK